MKKLLTLLVLLFGVVLFAQNLPASNYQVQPDFTVGMRIQHRLWNISDTSRVVVFNGDGSQNVFYDRSLGGKATVKVEHDEDGTIRNLCSGQSEAFKLNNFSVTTKGDTAIIDLDGAITPKGDYAVLEYTPMMLSWDYNRNTTYTATLVDGSTVSGIFSDETIMPNGTILIAPFTKLEITAENKKSKLVIEVLKGAPLIASEKRTNPWFERTYGIRLGANISLAPQQSVEHQIKVDCFLVEDGNQATVEAENLTRENRANIYGESLLPNEDYPTLFTPKSQAFTADTLSLADGLAFKQSGANSEDAGRLQRAFQRICQSEDITINPSSKSSVELKIGDKYCVNDSPEGFTLEVTKDKISIESASARGAFYGMQSLRWLAKDSEIKGQKIVDYPDLDYRAVQFFSAADSVDFHKDLINRLYAPLRINELVIECSRAHWDTIPNLRDKQGATKEELKELIDYAEENFINVTPLLATLGHTSWLFLDGQNLEFCEDPGSPFAYNVGHPELYPMMLRLFDEIYELFASPKYFHIGHDEWLMRGRYPLRTETKKRSIKQIFYDDVMIYYNHAKELDCKVMIWHDMLMTLEETRPSGIGAGGPPHEISTIRPNLPRDIIMAAWRYETEERYYDIETLIQEGFPVIGCGWMGEDNVVNVAQSVKAHDGMGYMQTTWAGFFPSEATIKEHFIQYAAYLEAAVYSWNTQNERFDHQDALRKIWLRHRDFHKGAGVAVELPQTVSADLSLLPQNTDFEAGFVDGIYFNRFKGNYISLKSRLQPNSPEEVEFAVNAKAKKLHFLHTTVVIPPEQGGLAGTYTLNYADGTKFVHDLTIPAEVTPLAGNPSLSFGMELYEGSAERVRAFTLENPHPEKEIKSIVATSQWRYLPLEIYALTLENL